MYLLKTGHALNTLGGASFVPRALFGENLNMVHPLGDIRDLDLLFLKLFQTRRFCMLQFTSQCKLCDIQDEVILTT